MMTVHAQCGAGRPGSGAAGGLGALRARIGRHRGGVERRVFDGVAHAEHVVVAHRFHVEQRAAVVQLEFAVPAVVDGVAEVHELRRRADVELHALEDGGHVVALEAQRPLHALGCRSGLAPAHSSMAICTISSRPNSWMHQAMPERSIMCPISSSSGTSTANSSRDSCAYRDSAHRPKIDADYVIKSTMTIAAGRRPAAVSPTRRTSAPRKRGDDTRAKIIDETVRCIMEEGFAAATAKHVAERAGVTWGVIQYHFGDRNGLLMAVVDDGVARLLTSLSSADVSELALRERIEVVVDTAWSCYSSPTSHGGLRDSAGHPRRPG